MGLLIPEINREQERTLLYRKFNMSKELKDETLKALISKENNNLIIIFIFNPENTEISNE